MTPTLSLPSPGPAPETHAHFTRIERVLDYIHANLDQSLSLEQLAEQTGLSKSALGKYESEDCGDINHYAIQKLAKFYGVSTDYLLGLKNKKITQMWTWRPCI